MPNFWIVLMSENRGDHPIRFLRDVTVAEAISVCNDYWASAIPSLHYGDYWYLVQNQSDHEDVYLSHVIDCPDENSVEGTYEPAYDQQVVGEYGSYHLIRQTVQYVGKRQLSFIIVPVVDSQSGMAYLLM